MPARAEDVPSYIVPKRAMQITVSSGFLMHKSTSAAVVHSKLKAYSQISLLNIKLSLLQKRIYPQAMQPDFIDKEVLNDRCQMALFAVPSHD